MSKLTEWILERTYTPGAGEANIGMTGAYRLFGQYLAASEEQNPAPSKESAK